LSELSWSRVRHPGEVLKVGQEVDVYVLGINPQEKKIALSIKRTQAEPWSRVAAKYEVGQLVRGVVTQLANFGAFARIEDGIEGLIHVSELADERITHPKQVVHEGQELLLRIIRIDPERRRMGLSLRRALDTPDAELEAVFGPGVIEERDRIVQQIREALEAEGIDMSAPVPAPAEEAESTEAAEAAEPATEEAVAAEATTEAPAETTDAEAPVEAETVAEAAPAEEPAPKTTRKRSSAKAAAEIPDAMDGEPLSAMAMAFAMAAPDLVVGEESEPAADASDAPASDGGEEREA
jgi:predicted RNA-binding protein with RPS1 domain